MMEEGELALGGTFNSCARIGVCFLGVDITQALFFLLRLLRWKKCSDFRVLVFRNGLLYIQQKEVSNVLITH